MKVSVFQPPYPKTDSTASAEECLGWMQARLDDRVPGDQDLILLPEYAAAPGLNDRQLLREFVESRGVDFLEAVAASAKRLHSLIALACPVRCETRWFNRTLVFDRTGHLAFTYDKIHLTDTEKDDLGLTPGAKTAIFQHEGIRIAFATCFDLYFPEHFESLAAQGADVVLCPSYQRTESAERIRLVAQARALDSGAFLIRSSYSMGDETVGGRSLVATPEGTLLADAGKNACVVSVELDPKNKFVKPASFRRPVVEHRALIESHRRPGVYRGPAQTSQQLESSPFPHMCAHRGLSQACPENTLPAFAAAIAAGAHEIEFDVRMSRDGIPTICHDESVDRTTNGTGKVSELSWDEIRRLDAGSHLGTAWVGVRIPRLEEVLDLVDGRIGMNVHLYADAPGDSTIKRVCDLLREHASMDLAYLALGDESSLRIALEYAPDLARACLVSQDDPAKSIAIAERYACQRIQFGRQVTAKQIEQAHEAGLICNMFWSDDPQDAMRYVQNGIDVILTNSVYTLITGGFRSFVRNLVDHG